MKARLAKKIALHAESRARALLGVEGKVDFGPFAIVLPADHALPRSLKEHPLYDRFLPYLASKLPQGSAVIDVGANVGDTVASMLAKNESLRFTCVEPDDVFFGYLERNIALIRASAPNVSISAVKSLVGKTLGSATLESHNGTAHAVASHAQEAKAARTLDEIASQAALGNISLLKVDVDGFDYDVLDSAENVIQNQAPLLFFECYVSTEDQLNGFKRTLQSLADKRYEHWLVFDNFGELVLRTREVEHVRQLIDYCWRQTQGRSTRTINYLDVLCATNRDAGLVEEVTSGYLSQRSI
jgi:FkbM family methyltransferase